MQWSKWKKKIRSVLADLKALVNNGIRKCMSIAFPVNPYSIVLESEGDYWDNPRAFYDYLIRNGLNHKYRIVWIVREPERYKKPENVFFVSRYGAGSYWKTNYYLATSKFFLFSHPYWFRHWRREQIVIHTTHGAAFIKAAHAAGTTVRRKIAFDFMLSYGAYGTENSQIVFGIPNKSALLELGVPRLDLLFTHKDCVKNLISDYSGQKVILSMETFKKSFSWDDGGISDRYALNVVRSEEELRALDDFLGKNHCVLLIKIHHLQDMTYVARVKLRNIHYLTDNDLQAHNIQLNELLTDTNLLLTDYSSVFYDYLLLNRPVGFMLGDMKEYKRGFLMENPLSEMPGQKIWNYTELIAFLSDFLVGQDLFQDERAKIRNKMFAHQDNRNCERLLEWMEHHI